MPYIHDAQHASFAASWPLEHMHHPKYTPICASSWSFT